MGLIPRSLLRCLTSMRQPLFSRDESLSKSMVRAKPRALVNAIYQTLRKPLMSKQFNKDEGNDRDVSLQTKAF